MRPQEIQLPDELDERLREWARAFKDRHRWGKCGSLEGQFNRFMPGVREESWGPPEPPGAILPPLMMPRVLRTHECVMSLPSRSQRWVITFRYCYPGMARHQVLKAMRKYTGKRFSWKEQENELEMAKMRVWACIL